MSFNPINAHRIPYHINGTRVGWNISNTSFGYANGVKNWITSGDLTNLNTEPESLTEKVFSFYYTPASNNYRECVVYFFFPELTYVKYVASLLYMLQPATNGGVAGASMGFTITGSANTTNGIDGDWLNPALDTTMSTGEYLNSGDDYWWRKPVGTSFTDAFGNQVGLKCLRIRMKTFYTNFGLYNIALYGSKATGETPDDIIFLKSDGVTEHTKLHDYGSIQEGTVDVTEFYIKNTSSTLTANNITISLEGRDNEDFLVSLDDITYDITVNAGTIPSGATQKIYVKNTVGAPPQILDPRNCLLKASVGSWT